MELSRRDAAVALATVGFTGGLALGSRSGRRDPTRNTGEDQQVREALVALAEVVYPSTVHGVEPFVESFLAGRLQRDDHADGLRRTVADLNDLAERWYGRSVPSLSPGERDRLLHEVGADTAEEDPDGTTSERVRYYVVNELLLALYTSPTGGELVGIENPPGHPGGIDSYQRGPTS